MAAERCKHLSLCQIRSAGGQGEGRGSVADVDLRDLRRAVRSLSQVDCEEPMCGLIVFSGDAPNGVLGYGWKP